MLRSSLPLLPLLLLLAPLQAAPQAAADPTLAAPSEAALARALETISADEISSDLYFIASDEMAGRDSPSPQQRVAARYIRARLQRLGFQPGAQDGAYLWEWNCARMGMDVERTWMKVSAADGAEVQLTWGEDYFLTRRALGRRKVDGAVVHCGTLDEGALKLDVAGKWLMGVSERGISNTLRTGATEAGAIGILVLPPQVAGEQTVAEAMARTTRFQKQARLSTRPSESAGFPVIYLGEDAGALMRGRVADGTERGATLGLTVSESCGYGQLEDAVLENVIGIWPGSDPELSKELIILSAHYDHVGARGEQIWNGADDNGSGTCGMLAIAEALTEYGPMRRTVMLMWVSAEEKGLLGSRAWTLDPYLPGGLVPLCNINIDMIGRNAPDQLGITPTDKRPEYSALTKAAEKHAASEGFGPLQNVDAYWGRSDHANFSRNLKIPVAFLFSDVHEDYHQPTDTPDKIDYDKMRRVCRLVMRMLHDLQIDRPEF